MLEGAGPLSAFDLSGRVAIVTGSSRGIGLAIAQRLLEAGAAVMRNGRALDAAALVALQATAERTDFQAADVSTEEGAQKLVDATVTRFGRLDILVNNAAIQPHDAWSAPGGTQWDTVFATNVRSVRLLVQAAVPAILRTAGAGSIINIASVRADRPGVGMLSYSASKAAVLSLTRGLAAELGSKGIRVNAVSPGLVDRAGLEQSWPDGVAAFRRDAPLGRIGQPRDVANACVFLAGVAADWITGVNLVVDGGVSLVR